MFSIRKEKEVVMSDEEKKIAEKLREAITKMENESDEDKASLKEEMGKMLIERSFLWQKETTETMENLLLRSRSTSEHLLMRTITAGAGSSTLYHGMAESQSWI